VGRGRATPSGGREGAGLYEDGTKTGRGVSSAGADPGADADDEADGWLVPIVSTCLDGEIRVRCACSNIIVHSRMPLDPTHVHLKRTCV
jgi:hypothetical protein